MAREFWYRLLRSVQGTQDGSAMINHQIESVYTDDPLATKEERITTPGYHKTASMDAADVEVVMDMPDATGLQRAAKNQAYKELMEVALEQGPYSPPPKLWDDASMQVYTAENDEAVLQADRVNTYVTVTLGQAYPADFKLLDL